MSVTSSSTIAEEEEEKLLGIYNETPFEPSQSRPSNPWQQTIKRLIPWLLHLSAILAYTIVFVRHRTSFKGYNVLRPTEIPSAMSIVREETVRWNPTDWSGITRPNEFEGPPNPERDAAWERLVDVGMYSLTKEEYALFPEDFKTATVATNPEDHVVLIEMFHQLHCLHMFRALIYNGAEKNIYHENPQQVPLHIDHCIDYMRQAVMCHGDLTPLRLTYRPQGGPSYFPEFSSQRTCRNFDKIYEWALAGNRSGKHLEF